MNVQNVPRKDKVVKRGFIPKLDCFVFFDYIQIEYRLLAYYLAAAVDDWSMAEVFKAGNDLHAESAIAIHQLDREPTDDERQEGKIYNFLTIYGGGAAKAANSLNIPVEKARELQELFHARWPGIRQIHNPPGRNGWTPPSYVQGALQRRLKQRGYITTLLGRHLRPERPHKALNTLIQGCAADLMRWALVQVHSWATDQGLKSHLVNVVHDEMIFDAITEEVPLLAETVPGLMVFQKANEVVPIESETEVSWTNWAEKTPYPSDDEQPEHLGRTPERAAA